MIKTISTEEIQKLISQTEDYIEINFNKDNSNLYISGLSVFIKDFVNIICSIFYDKYFFIFNINFIYNRIIF